MVSMLNKREFHLLSVRSFLMLPIIRSLMMVSALFFMHRLSFQLLIFTWSSQMVLIAMNVEPLHMNHDLNHQMFNEFGLLCAFSLFFSFSDFTLKMAQRRTAGFLFVGYFALTVFLNLTATLFKDLKLVFRKLKIKFLKIRQQKAIEAIKKRQQEELKQ